LQEVDQYRPVDGEIAAGSSPDFDQNDPAISVEIRVKSDVSGTAHRGAGTRHYRALTDSSRIQAISLSWGDWQERDDHRRAVSIRV
jgi:hypothetical protein